MKEVTGIEEIDKDEIELWLDAVEVHEAKKQRELMQYIPYNNQVSYGKQTHLHFNANMKRLTRVIEVRQGVYEQQKPATKEDVDDSWAAIRNQKTKRTPKKH